MSPLDLRCTPGETSGFCLNGGVCIRDVSLGLENAYNRCVCPEGVIHDFTISHSENCGIGSFGQLVGVFATLTVIFFAALCFLVYLARYRSRRRVRRNIYFRILYLVVTYLAVLSVFVQQGSFIAAFTFQAISSNLLIRLVFDMATIGNTAFDPASAEKIRKLSLALETFLVVEQSIIAIPVLITAGWSRHSGDPFLFNLAFIIMCACQAGSGTIGFGLLIRQYRKLSEFVVHLSRQNVSEPEAMKKQQDDLLARIQGSIKQSRITIITLAAVMIIPILLISMGSIPGQLWIWFAFISTIPLGVVGGAKKLAASMSSSSQQSSLASTEHRSKASGEASNSHRQTIAINRSQSALTISSTHANADSSRSGIAVVSDTAHATDVTPSEVVSSVASGIVPVVLDMPPRASDNVSHEPSIVTDTKLSVSELAPTLSE